MYLKTALSLLSILDLSQAINLGSPEEEPMMPNMQEGLLPPNKIWRGSTMQPGYFDTGSWYGMNPYEFEERYGEPLHIMRTFKASSNPEIDTEAEWIRNGGILFYSI